MTSVLQDWVMKLPLRAQGTILTGIRGCDLALDGLYARIDAAPSSAKPVFNGIADLHDALNR